MRSDAAIQHAGNAGMIEVGQDLAFRSELQLQLRAMRESGTQHFDGNGAVEACVASLPNLEKQLDELLKKQPASAEKKN